MPVSWLDLAAFGLIVAVGIVFMLAVIAGYDRDRDDG